MILFSRDASAGQTINRAPPHAIFIHVNLIKRHISGPTQHAYLWRDYFPSLHTYIVPPEPGEIS